MRSLWLAIVAAVAACSVPARAPAGAAVAPELAALDGRKDIDGRPLPPRADAPRTLVMFFASW
ncbi:MAG: hypothetical protein D6689_00675 [Deltaproteobacteria bacterium]|nr:MAG: hypothetical protein D6689_00675 [Deltaproteobacteria bacterium]